MFSSKPFSIWHNLSSPHTSSFFPLRGWAEEDIYLSLIDQGDKWMPGKSLRKGGGEKGGKCKWTRGGRGGTRGTSFFYFHYVFPERGMGRWTIFWGWGGRERSSYPLPPTLEILYSLVVCDVFGIYDGVGYIMLRGGWGGERVRWIYIQLCLSAVFLCSSNMKLS